MGLSRIIKNIKGFISNFYKYEGRFKTRMCKPHRKALLANGIRLQAVKANLTFSYLKAGIFSPYSSPRPSRRGQGEQGEWREGFFLRGKKAAGFTLIELLVSISIIGLLSAIFLVNYRATSQRSQLNITAQKVASDIRLAQSNSLGSVEYDGSIPDGGWGAHFSEGESYYYVFADLDANNQYDEGEASEELGGKVVDLPAGITINSINIGTLVDIVFLPPDPITYINNDNSGTVEIELADNISSKIVTVNFFGLIDVVGTVYYGE
ncbi:MAG: prepilin-type N-terminal cleavage/methylation domain-containing protein [Patescibacteria group bacterium]